MMDEERLRNEELQIQHFQFSATQFIANFKKRIHDDIRDVLGVYEKKALAKEGVDKNVIKEEIKKLMQEYNIVRDEVMSVAEEEIRKFFSIPEAAIPRLDWTHNYNSETDENIEDLEEEVKELERQYLKEQTFQKLCHAELEKLKALDPIFKKMDTVLSDKIVINKPIPPKTEKLINLYDKTLFTLTEVAPEVVGSVYGLNSQFS